MRYRLFLKRLALFLGLGSCPWRKSSPRRTNDVWQPTKWGRSIEPQQRRSARMGLFQCHLPVVSPKEIESVRNRYEVWSWFYLNITYYYTTIETIIVNTILDWSLVWIFLGPDLLDWRPVLNTQMVLGKQLLPTISTWWFLDCAYLISITVSNGPRSALS